MPDTATALARSAALTDEEVVSRVLAGDKPLFEVLMRRHNERVYRAARAILRDDKEAEDVMQEAYVNAYSHLAIQQNLLDRTGAATVQAFTFGQSRCDQVVAATLARLFGRS